MWKGTIRWKEYVRTWWNWLIHWMWKTISTRDPIFDLSIWAIADGYSTKFSLYAVSTAIRRTYVDSTVLWLLFRSCRENFIVIRKWFRFSEMMFYSFKMSARLGLWFCFVGELQYGVRSVYISASKLIARWMLMCLKVFNNIVFRRWRQRTCNHILWWFYFVAFGSQRGMCYWVHVPKIVVMQLNETSLNERNVHSK